MAFTDLFWDGKDMGYTEAFGRSLMKVVLKITIIMKDDCNFRRYNYDNKPTFCCFIPLPHL